MDHGFHRKVGRDGVEVQFFNQALVDLVIALHVTRRNLQNIIVISANFAEIPNTRNRKKASIFLSLSKLARINAAPTEFFSMHLPARSAVEVSTLPPRHARH